MNMHHRVEPYVNECLIGAKKGPDNLTLLCYTKRAFHNFTWDETTKLCRGLVIDADGNAVNAPFPKIFNIGEVPETKEPVIRERMKNEAFDVIEKSNGHLCILFYHNGTWYNTTKGSWDMEFVEQDRKLLESLGIFDVLNGEASRFYQGFTYMFEIIAEYDKHTLYDIQREKFGRDTAVLLGVRAIDEGDVVLDAVQSLVEGFAKKLGVDYPETYDHIQFGDISQWYKHRNTEGYVIRFCKDNFRVKVKCDEYLKLRMIHHLEWKVTFPKLFKEFGQDLDKALPEVPEEFHKQYRLFVADFGSWFIHCVVFADPIDEILTDLTDKLIDGELTKQEACKAVGLNETLTQREKAVIFGILRGKADWASQNKKHWVDDYVATLEDDHYEVDASSMFN